MVAAWAFRHQFSIGTYSVERTEQHSKHNGRPYSVTSICSVLAQVEQGLLTAGTRLDAVRDVIDSIAKQFPHLQDVLGRVSKLSEDAIA